MVKSIALFELRNGFRRISTYIYFALFFGLGYLTFLVAAGAFPGVDLGLGAGGKLFANSAYLLYALISGTSFYGLLVVAAVMGNVVHQDFRHNTFPLVFTQPVSKQQYLAGRFLAANVILLFIFSSMGIACFVASLTPTVDESLIGPHRLLAYLQPYLIAVIPNTFFIGAVFFGVAALSRNMLPVYVSAVILFVGYLIASILASQLDSKYAAGLIDPFGNYALEHVTKYWTVAEKNAESIPVTGMMLVNRLIWTAVGIGALGITCWLFRLQQGGEDRRRIRETVTASAPIRDLALPVAAVRVSSQLWMLPRLTWLEFKGIVASTPFLLIVTCGIGVQIVASMVLNSMFGTSVYPVTAVIAEIVRGSFSLFILIIIIVYSGQLVWRERESGMGQLFDAQPVSTWLPFVSKTAALILIQAFLMMVVMVTGMAVQTAKGYFNYEPDVYFRDLFGIQFVHFALLSIMAMTIQVVVNHKHLGQFVMVLFLLSNVLLNGLDFDHHLYRYATNPGYTYSDMNGFGHFMIGVGWFDLYWVLFAILLVVFCNLMWVRGLETSLDARMNEARSRWTIVSATVAVTTLVLLIVVGVFIYRNTNVLNTFDRQIRTKSAKYEKQYKKYEQRVQPRIGSVDVNVDIFPQDRRIHVHGNYTLINKTDQPIDSVFVNLPNEDIQIVKLKLGSVEAPSASDVGQGVYRFELADPIAPKESVPLEFDLEYGSKGFKNHRGDTQIVYNGTFFSHGNLPQIGYLPGRELMDDAVRRKHKLEPKQRMAKIDDLPARSNNYISRHADWIDFQAIVSTSSDQIAVAPGSLQREWTEGDRRYFHYKADGRILCFYSFLSARYEVLRDSWNDVAIEIYYHPGHEYNLESMVKAMKAALEYCSTNFSPYQHKQARILEFPRYQTFAQSFPNTIPYSESIGFIAKVDPDDEKDIDYPVYVTAHEIAHQWWAHQVVGGDVQGATMLSETLAQYSALMVMKEMFGPKKMKRFLRHELDRYLQGRGGERKKELPLALVENQAYIHYNKGSLVMYALQDYIGEDTLNQALKNFVQETGFQEPPYTTSRELIEHIRQVTPEDLQYLIDDLFESITLFENRAVSATYRRVDGGKFEVTINVTSKKVHADELGAESEVELRDQIDIGVLDRNGEYLYLEKRQIDTAENQFIVKVSGRPSKAGIDPINKLIDRQPENNVVKVKKLEDAPAP